MVWMMLALAGIATLAAWDATRESTAALDDFAAEQLTLARALATTTERVAPPSPASLDVMRAVERVHALRVLVCDGDGNLHTTDGREMISPPLWDAHRAKVESLRLSREDSAALGLSRRLSVAAFAPIDPANETRGAVVVVASAERVRDRERRAFWRLLSSVVVAAALVFAFGGMALRRQRKQLSLQHALEIATLQEERDRKLAAADKIATMGALATGIAHEVSTPLNVIVGRAEQMQSRVADEKDKKAVAAILEQADRISRIVRGLLGLARGDSPALEKVPASSLANKARELVQHRFAKAEVALDVDVQAKLPAVACDPRLLEQALVNLLLNACDACAPGGRVKLAVKNGGTRVTFSVDDNGAGITEEAAARATEAFFTTKSGGAGTGLGLAIASEIVKHHGGTLAIAPHAKDEGPGTRARIEVPASEESSHA